MSGGGVAALERLAQPIRKAGPLPRWLRLRWTQLGENRLQDSHVQRAQGRGQRELTRNQPAKVDEAGRREIIARRGPSCGQPWRRIARCQPPDQVRTAHGNLVRAALSVEMFEATIEGRKRTGPALPA